ncbi:hypothetical protein QWY99_07975 [Flavobacterium branchiarum]|uniref:Uncharacterized protein n=1 Tax=Flavobacterium branchiarum TaxID=1114870 RepID=A0ABV5FQK5_9FLAO|nr:hypothetical protein [Flavobacterium branchiarum]MDN3672986.1 hypothetical protein [Flavobacterium branchiarum]
MKYLYQIITVTRTATYNKYKKVCEEKGICIELLVKYGLNYSIIQDFTKKNQIDAELNTF